MVVFSHKQVQREKSGGCLDTTVCPCLQILENHNRQMILSEEKNRIYYIRVSFFLQERFKIIFLMYRYAKDFFV